MSMALTLHCYWDIVSSKYSVYLEYLSCVSRNLDFLSYVMKWY